MIVKSFKLPELVYPVNYDLFFDVDLNKFKFLGKEIIDLKITKPTSKIILNARDLKIPNVYLTQGTSIKPKVKLENDKELLTLSFSKTVKGPAKLHLEFSGKLTDSLVGFYRSKYKVKNKEKYIATTHFEAARARRAFPCFDEPTCKATFDVSLKISKNLQAISNTPVKEEIIDGDKKIVKFHVTPKMSTYLLYLGIGEFEFLEGKLNHILIRIATTPDKKQQAKFALDLTKKFLSYFQEYSKILYPLPKLDLIALPDFEVTAMENWGAITFREIALLFDPKMTSTAVKKRIAMVIAHELWHQWSGNLVTMRWWDDLWLNESFATFMAYKAVDHFFPEWKIWEDFISDETERAFTDDSLKTTHPIEVEVKNPHEIEEIFDAISYSKGGSILRMLENYLGEEIFRKGVSNYLSANKYGSATSEDMWNSLSKVSSKPVKEIMMSWIRQAGYPLIEIVLENHTLLLRQKKFVFNQTDSHTLWKVPLVIKLSNSRTINELLSKKEKKIALNQTVEWFKLNYNQTGFYQVKYSNEAIHTLESLIANKELPALDRWGIQNDLFELTRNDETTLDKYLDFINCYRNEDNYLVLSSIYSNLRSIYFVFCQQNFWQQIWPKFKNHFIEAPNKILNKLGWEPKEGENQKDALLRESTIRYLGFVENSEVLKKSIELFEKYLKKQISLHPDIKAPMCYITAANGDKKTYKKLLEVYSKAQTPEERRILLLALGQFKDPEIIKKYLDFSLTKKVRVQDLIIVFSSIASNPYSRNELLPWFKKNWKKIQSYQRTGKIFMNLLEAFIISFVSRYSEKELKKFFATHPVKYKMTLERSFEKMRRHISWLEKNREVLQQYFG